MERVSDARAFLISLINGKKWHRFHPIKQRGKWKQRPNNPEVFLKYNKKYLTK